MNANLAQCPETKNLKLFLQGQLPVSDIENYEGHLSQCAHCLETVEGLKVSDTFLDVAREALIEAEQSAESPNDDSLVRDMMADAKSWTRSDGYARFVGDKDVAFNKAAEVQRLLRAPLQTGDLGAVAHFRILELIGAGSTGIVYRALDTKLERDVVLKILRPSLGDAAKKRFVAEAKATAAINHPNVVAIYEVGSDGPLSYISMPWIPGKTLEQWLVKEESLSVDQVRKLVEEVALGLIEAHAKGLIHRDIKPANIWICADDESVKILDFGLVRVNDEDPQLTCTGMIAGTPCFMSPEQSRGDKLDPRSDLFSLGCLMYQALTGQLPFRSDNALATLRSIQKEQPVFPAELDPAIDSDTSDLVMCLLQKSPARRPDSASSVVEALKTGAETWSFERHQPAPQPKTRSGRKHSWRKSIVATLLGAGLAMFGFNYGQQIIHIVTNTGQIEIDTSVNDVKIEVLAGGEVVKVIDLATEESIEIKAGSYEIRPVGDQNSVVIEKNVLTLRRGEKEIVKVTRSQDEEANTTQNLAEQTLSLLPRARSLYKGKNYQEWLEIARTDREAGYLIDALYGITNLARGRSQKIESQETLMQIARRGPGSCSKDERIRFVETITNFIDNHSKADKIRMFIREVRCGTRTTRRYVLSSSLRRLEVSRHFDEATKVLFNDLVSALNEQAVINNDGYASLKYLDEILLLGSSAESNLSLLELHDNSDLKNIFSMFGSEVSGLLLGDTLDEVAPTVSRVAEYFPQTDGLTAAFEDMADDIVKRLGVEQEKGRERGAETARVKSSDQYRRDDLRHDPINDRWVAIAKNRGSSHRINMFRLIYSSMPKDVRQTKAYLKVLKKDCYSSEDNCYSFSSRSKVAYLDCQGFENTTFFTPLFAKRRVDEIQFDGKDVILVLNANQFDIGKSSICKFPVKGKITIKKDMSGELLADEGEDRYFDKLLGHLKEISKDNALLVERSEKDESLTLRCSNWPMALELLREVPGPFSDRM